MNFYNHYLGDYIRDTKELTLIEHGAYRVLLDHCYATEEMPPPDLKKVYRIAGAMTTAEREAVKKVVEKFFPVNGDGRRHHKRVEEELVKAHERAEDEAAKNENEAERQRRHRERRKRLFAELRAVGVVPKFDTTTEELQRLHNAHVTRDSSVPVTPPVTPNVTRDTTAIQNHNQKENQELANASLSKPAVSPCPHLEVIEAYHRLLPAGRRVNPKLWNGTRAKHLQARWREDAERQTLAWWERFFAYIAESKFLTGQVPPPAGRQPFEISLDWIVNPTNFAKIHEGTYHR